MKTRKNTLSPRISEPRPSGSRPASGRCRCVPAQPMRRISYRASLDLQPIVFLTNHLALPALTIAELYRCHWRIELFFKWIKQHLRIKA
ncbi:MAG: transposase, partial [Bryobacteraceae bacterium]